MSDAIRFGAQIFKFQTLIDGGARLTLDLLPIDDETLVALFNAKQPGVILEIAAVVVKQAENNDIQKRPKRKSEWTPA